MNRSTPQTTIIIAGAILVVLILLNLVGALKPLESLVGLVLTPISKTLQITGKSQLEKDKAQLEAKVSELNAELAKREEAKLQNDALRSQLNFAQSNNYKLAQANITSQDPTNYQQFFTIDRGSTSGIQKGMPVVVQSNLIGRIIETTPNTAKVYLITDYNSAVPVIDQQTRATGLVRGQRGFGLILDSVPQTEQLKTGDTVLTSGFGGDYPKGLIVGTVGDIQRRDSDVYQTASIKPAVDFRRLESVFVILGTNETSN